MLSDNCVTAVHSATLANACKSPFEWNNWVGLTCCVGLHLDRGSVVLSE